VIIFTDLWLSLASALLQFIKWLSNLRKKYGKVYRVFTGNRAYVVLMDKVVRPPTFLTRKDTPSFLCA
jgi:hypothetical protein